MDQGFIELVGARENNLKNISLSLPRNKITVFTGVSGSGKSSIVFDTIAQEAGRQLNETYSSFTRLFLPRYKRPEVDEIRNLSTAIVIDQHPLGGNSRSTLGTATDINALLRLLYSRFGEPHIGYGNAYSFNDPVGMCPGCEGIGRIITLNTETALDRDKSLNEGAILLPGYNPGSYYWKTYAESGFFDNDRKLKDYSAAEWDKLVYAKPQKVAVSYHDTDFNASYEGLAVRFMRQNVKTEKETTKLGAKRMALFSTTATCPDCGGKRYNQMVLASRLNGYSIYDLTAVQLDDLAGILDGFTDPRARPIVDSIRERVRNLNDIGLGYMDLSRETPTLSGGESQRVKMVKHLSSSLTGLLYIFDEPSIGLHPRDVHRLIELLVRLRDKGNTVLVVEHDPDVIRIGDYIVDMGPKAGSGGGRVMYSGSYEGLLASDTLTARHLGRKTRLNLSPRAAAGFIESGASSLHNLKNVRLRVPAGVLTVVTGVAGSGKSTLVHQVFAREHPEAVLIDQSPVQANSRSNPATFTDIMTSIRNAFAEANGVPAGLFSYNSDGACPACKGTGVIELNLSFMDKMEVECSSCNGSRFRDDVLSYRFKGKSIVEVMAMTVDEAVGFFEAKELKTRLEGLGSIGLDYLRLGQPLDTLSGGECQRLRLARELGRKGSVFILDEPTTGLHMSDIDRLLRVIDGLIARGNTVVVIEHNLDVIRRADWIIDMGPYGGSAGGRILYEGTLEGILSCEQSVTAKYLS